MSGRSKFTEFHASVGGEDSSERVNPLVDVPPGASVKLSWTAEHVTKVEVRRRDGAHWRKLEEHPGARGEAQVKPTADCAYRVVGFDGGTQAAAQSEIVEINLLRPGVSPVAFVVPDQPADRRLLRSPMLRRVTAHEVAVFVVARRPLRARLTVDGHGGPRASDWQDTVAVGPHFHVRLVRLKLGGGKALSGSERFTWDLQINDPSHDHPATLSGDFTLSDPKLDTRDIDLTGVRLGAEAFHVQGGYLRPQGQQIPPRDDWSMEVQLLLDLPGVGSLPLDGRFGKDGFEFQTTEAFEIHGYGFRAATDRHGQPLPTLKVTAGPLSRRLTLSMEGLIDLPHHQGKRALHVQGSLGIRSSHGKPEVVGFEAAGSSDSEWTFPGGLTLSKLSARLRRGHKELHVEVGGKVKLFPGGEIAKTSGAEGSAELAAHVRRSDDGNLRLKGAIQHIDLDLFNQVRVIDTELHFDFQTDPEQGHVRLGHCTAGMIRTGDGHGLDAYMFEVQKVSAALDLRQGFALQITHGEMDLPERFFHQGGTAKLRVGRRPITVAWDDPHRELTIGGSVTVADLSLAAPNAPGQVSATLDHITAVFDASLSADELLASNPDKLKASVRLENGAGKFKLTLPDGQVLELSFDNLNFDRHGFPSGTLRLDRDVSIVIAGSGDDAFKVTIRGRSNPRGGCSVTVARDGETDNHRFHFEGGLSLEVPLSVLQNGDDGAPTPNITGGIAGWLEFTDAPQNPAFDAAITEIDFDAKNFRLGGVLTIKDAALEADNVDQLFRRDRNPQKPFTLKLSGNVQYGDDGPSFALDESQFLFADSDLTKQPKFQTRGIRFQEGQALSQKFPYLVVKEAGLDFRDPGRDILPADLTHSLFAPDNFLLTAGLGVQIPFGGRGQRIMAEVDGVEVSIDRGLPHVTVDGIGFGVENLNLCGTIITGIFYVSGLRALLDAGPDATHLPPLLFAGALGGSVDGVMVKVLGAFEGSPTDGIKPLGFSLDVNAGPAGIPLGPDGFLLTGAGGGFSFTNSNADPGELAAYVDVPKDRKPDPNQKGKGDSKQGAGPSRKKDYPQPAWPPAGFDFTQPVPSIGRYGLPVVRPAPATGADGSALPDCPGDCPPPSMNVLCMPHPDTDTFPHRPIVKFTSIDQQALQRIVSAVPGLPDLTTISAPNCDQGTIDQVTRALGAGVPVLSGVVDALGRQVMSAMRGAGAANAWQVLSWLAYAGLPCEDQTEQLTGTLSYAGISAFASITGGFRISTTGTVGAIGYLNVFGMRVGKLRAFFTATNEVGDVQPSICGDLRLEIGPLEVGLVSFNYRVGGAVFADLSGLADALGRLAAGKLQPILDSVGGTLQDWAGAGDKKKLLAAVSRVITVGVSEFSVAELKDFIFAILDAYWDLCTPDVRMCGMVAPKLFGIPLGGDLIGVRGWMRKRPKERPDALQGFEYGAQLSFSPSYVLSEIVPLAGFICGPMTGFDQATLGASVTFPDPLSMLEQFIDLFLAAPDPEEAPEQAAAVAQKAFSLFLSNAVFQGTYQFAPFGLHLADGVMRAVMPYLADHPSRHADWKPAGAADGDQRATRPALLDQALAKGVLTQLEWRGIGGDLEALFPDNTAMAGQELVKDYFPHGGLIGAAHLGLPRILTDEPQLDTLGKIAGRDPSLNLIQRAQLAGQFARDYIATLVPHGSLHFYLPAPDPPGPLDDQQALLRSICEVATGINMKAVPFLEGWLDCSLLGVPIGQAKVLFQPGPPACMQIVAAAPGVNGNFTATLRQVPARPLDVTFSELATKLAGVSSDSQAQAMLGEFGRALFEELPKMELQASANVQIPQSLAQVLSVPAGAAAFTLCAYTPGFARAADESPQEQAKEIGGAVAAGMLRLKMADFSCDVDAQVAMGTRMHGAWRARADVPAGGVTLTGVSGAFDSAPDRPAEPLATLFGNFTLDGIGFSGNLEFGGIKIPPPVPSYAAQVALHLTLPQNSNGHVQASFTASATYQGVTLSTGQPISLGKVQNGIAGLLGLMRTALAQAWQQQIAQALCSIPGSLAQFFTWLGDRWQFKLGGLKFPIDPQPEFHHDRGRVYGAFGPITVSDITGASLQVRSCKFDSAGSGSADLQGTFTLPMWIGTLSWQGIQVSDFAALTNFDASVRFSMEMYAGKFTGKFWIGATYHAVPGDQGAQLAEVFAEIDSQPGSMNDLCDAVRGHVNWSVPIAQYLFRVPDSLGQILVWQGDHWQLNLAGFSFPVSPSFHTDPTTHGLTGTFPPVDIGSAGGVSQSSVSGSFDSAPPPGSWFASMQGQAAFSLPDSLSVMSVQGQVSVYAWAPPDAGEPDHHEEDDR